MIPADILKTLPSFMSSTILTRPLKSNRFAYMKRTGAAELKNEMNNEKIQIV